MTLKELAADPTLGPSFLGTAVSGKEFPLLVKILDPVHWLSAQVHPDDGAARRLEGEDATGKTEAWHIIDAEPGAKLVLGMHGTREELKASMASPAMKKLLRYREAKAGDTFLVPAKTMHAVGAGLLVYEVQQPRGVTYRAYDWDSDRELHVDKTLDVVDVESQGRHLPLPDSKEGRLLDTPFFKLDRIDRCEPITVDPGGKSFHAITVLEGPARLRGEGWTQELQSLQTAVVPANAGPFTLEPLTRGERFVALDSSKG
jgi:mannose-6-phosphate isomerase